MLTFILCLVILAVGFCLYGRLTERIMQPKSDPTPAVRLNDGVDYVPLPKWKNFIIQLLDIAGTGPIFGALMGAVWGPAVFLWIVFGTILGGAVHDYMSGMISVRKDGASITDIVTEYLGRYMKYPILLLSLLLLIMVTAVFSQSAASLLSALTGSGTTVWIVVIVVYFSLSAFLPIDKIIGRFYPIFGLALIVMAIVIVCSLLMNGFAFPEMTLTNLHPDGTPIWPFMFITVACGAISGFHSTQSPLVGRCLKDEREGRHVFYGAMVAEGVIALIWASAGLAFYGSTGGLAEAIASGGTAKVVYEISDGVAGVVGTVLAVVGVVICPITSGDTALRSARLIFGSYLGFDQKPIKNRLIITVSLVAICVVLINIDFTIIWRYFSWLNQTLAAVVLWAATVYLLTFCKRRYCSFITALPATFMSAVVSSYILTAPEGLGIDYSISVAMGIAVAALCFILFLHKYIECGKNTGVPEN